MRRIMLLATVAALMAVLVMVSASAAVAHDAVCPSMVFFPTTVAAGTNGDLDGDTLVCQRALGLGGEPYIDDHDHAT